MRVLSALLATEDVEKTRLDIEVARTMVKSTDWRQSSTQVAETQRCPDWCPALNTKEGSGLPEAVSSES